LPSMGTPELGMGIPDSGMQSAYDLAGQLTAFNLNSQQHAAARGAFHSAGVLGLPQQQQRQFAGGRGGRQFGAGGRGVGGHVPKAQRFCRNVVIHGICRNAGRGCEYNHNVPEAARIEMARQHVALSGGAAQSGGRGGAQMGRGFNTHMMGTDGTMAPTALPFFPGSTAGSPPKRNTMSGVMAGAGRGSKFMSADDPVVAQLNFMPGNAPAFDPSSSGQAFGTGAGTTAGTVPRGFEPLLGGARTRASRPTARRRVTDFSMPEHMRQDLQMRAAHTYATLPSDDPRAAELPSTVNRVYHSLYPLDDNAEKQPLPDASSVLGCPTRVYKAICSTDGLPCVLLRLDISRIGGDIRAKEVWRELQHPSIVGFRDVFVSNEFSDGQNSLVLVYDFIPGAQTLQERYVFNLRTLTQVPESVLWSYIAQVLAALRLIHSQGLASRCIAGSKLLVSGESRIRLMCVGAMDMITSATTSKNSQERQWADLTGLGRVLLEVMCHNIAAWQPANLAKSLEFVGTQYSEELKHFILLVLSPPQGSPPPTVFELSTTPLFAARLLSECDNLYNQLDILERACSQEMENGRMMRLLIKLGLINERPDYDTDPHWAEHGDRYLLKLFRDYVFHQSTEDRRPYIDFGSIMSSLNKLDVGVDEKVMLMSRDEKNILVVSYADIKNCVEGAFQELFAASNAGPSSNPPHAFQPL